MVPGEHPSDKQVHRARQWLLRLLAGLLLAGSVWGAEGGAERLAQEAIRLLQAGKPAEAIETLKRAIAGDARYFPAYSLLGVSYSQLGRFQEAQPYFEKAVELAPQSAQARNNLGANLLALEKPAEAAAQFRLIVAAEPGNLSAWVNLANSELRLDNFAAALAALERARKLAPDDLQVQLALVEANLKAGHREQALGLARTLGAGGRDARLQLALGVLLARNGQGPEAAGFLGRAVSLEPAATPHLLELARESLDAADYPAALALLEAVRNRQQDSSAWHEMTGYAQAKLGNHDAALEHLQKAVQLEPANEDYYLALGEFLAENNAIDALGRVFETAARALPDSPKIQAGLGLTYILVKDYEQAEQTLERLIGASPDFETGYKLLADCYYRAKAWEKLRGVAAAMRTRDESNSLGWHYGAVAEYQLLGEQDRAAAVDSVRQHAERALELAPGDWRPQALLGKLSLETNRLEEALEAFRRAVSLNPEEPSSHYLLATTLRRLGRAEESKAAFQAFERAQAEYKVRNFRTMMVEFGEP
jgi:Flp pilus assembly protein TadD